MGSTSHNHFQLVYDNNQLWNHLQTWQTCPSRRKRWSRLSSQLPPPPPSSPPRSLAAASSSSWSWSCSRWWWWWWCCCQWSNQGAFVGHRAKPQSYGRSVSFPEAREREGGRRKAIWGSLYCSTCIRVHTYILLPIGAGVLWRVHIVFYWCFYGGWHAPIPISAAKPKLFSLLFHFACKSSNILVHPYL